MNAMHRLRTEVFHASQQEMARIAGVNQSTISKWESGAQIPLSTALGKIRDYAKRRYPKWQDSWLFEGP